MAIALARSANASWLHFLLTGARRLAREIPLRVSSDHRDSTTSARLRKLTTRTMAGRVMRNPIRMVFNTTVEVTSSSLRTTTTASSLIYSPLALTMARWSCCRTPTEWLVMAMLQRLQVSGST